MKKITELIFLVICLTFSLGAKAGTEAPEETITAVSGIPMDIVRGVLMAKDNDMVEALKDMDCAEESIAGDEERSQPANSDGNLCHPDTPNNPSEAVTAADQGGGENTVPSGPGDGDPGG